jgi:hypothetical protein
MAMRRVKALQIWLADELRILYSFVETIPRTDGYAHLEDH